MKNPEKGENNILIKLMATTPSLSNKTIRDEVMTLLLAGHETTSNTLTWSLMYLCQNPKWQNELKAELAALGKNASELTRAEILNLKKHRSFIQEALRLSPPIPVISRRVVEKDTIGGYEIEAGVSVCCVPLVTQRDERFWSNPNDFDPTRFYNREDKKDDFTYFPFARGARSCIGEDLAMVESILTLAHLAQNFSWKLEDGFTPIPVHHLTLRSENGMKVESSLL